MTLKLDRPTKMWVLVDGCEIGEEAHGGPCVYATKSEAEYRRNPGETVERVLVTVTRVKAGKGKRNGK